MSASYAIHKINFFWPYLDSCSRFFFQHSIRCKCVSCRFDSLYRVDFPLLNATGTFQLVLFFCTNLNWILIKLSVLIYQSSERPVNLCFVFLHDLFKKSNFDFALRSLFRHLTCLPVCLIYYILYLIVELQAHSNDR